MSAEDKTDKWYKDKIHWRRGWFEVYTPWYDRFPWMLLSWIFKSAKPEKWLEKKKAKK